MMKPQFDRAKTAFDNITGQSYYGFHMREVLATDPIALLAAEVLAERVHDRGSPFTDYKPSAAHDAAEEEKTPPTKK
jgi:hypothetical protein